MPTTQDLLKKINYLEAEIEVQKSLLFSLGSSQTEEMEEILTIIAERKNDISRLRSRIEESDPDEFARIQHFEKAVATLRNLAETREFRSIVGRRIGEEFSLALADGNDLDCLIKATDRDGNWLVVTMDGEIMEFPGDQVREPAPGNIIE